VGGTGLEVFTATPERLECNTLVLTRRALDFPATWTGKRAAVRTVGATA